VTGVQTCALPISLKESRHWRVAYDDGLAIVFRPAGAVAGGREQFFTGGTGGIGGRDQRITAAQNVHPKDHAAKKQGVVIP
jgi:hypothetical protein